MSGEQKGLQVRASSVPEEELGVGVDLAKLELLVDERESLLEIWQGLGVSARGGETKISSDRVTHTPERRQTSPSARPPRPDP